MYYLRVLHTDHIDDDYGVFAEGLGPLVEFGLVELEGRHVRREDRRVDHQDQDQPIPSGLEHATPN